MPPSARSSSTFVARGKYDAPDLEQAIAEVQPDLLVVDINAWGATVAAQASGLPYVTFSPYTPPIRSEGTPPFGPGFKPLPGLLGRVRDGLLRPLVMGAAEKAMGPGIAELRSARGLPPVGSADEFFRSAPLMLVTTAEPFEYHHEDWGDDISMIGASAWEPPGEVPAELTSWLDASGRPLVLVTTSSEFQDDGSLVRTALEALADEPVSVVATMPAGVPDDLVVPANARVERFVPHGPLLERAAVAVTHGGMGGTQKALVARRTRLCGAVRPRPARGGPTRRGERLRDAGAGAQAGCGAAAQRRTRGDGLHRRGPPGRRGLPRHRRRGCCRGPHREAVRLGGGAGDQLIATAGRPAAAG